MEDDFYDDFYDDSSDDWDDVDEPRFRDHIEIEDYVPNMTFQREPFLWSDTFLLAFETEAAEDMLLHIEAKRERREDDMESHAQDFEKRRIRPRNSTWFTRRENRPSPRRNRGRKPRDRFERRVA